MKSTILLATAIFLACAPSPDSKSIAEMSAGFLTANGNQGLMAAESVMNDRNFLVSYDQQVIAPAKK